MSDCERPETLRETTPVARKVHTCCECGGAIQQGEKYHNTWGVWDGEQYTFKTCAECNEIRLEIFDKEAGFYYGGLLEDLQGGCPDTVDKLKRFRVNQEKRNAIK